MKVRSFVEDWMPPAFVRAFRTSINGSIRFDGDYATWEEAAAQCTGYDAEHILTKVLDATLKVKRGEVAYERDSVVFDEIQYDWPVTAGLMWAAAQSDGRLNVLDYGGALGSSYFQNRAFLAELPHVSWSVVEQAHYVDAGQKYIQDQTLRFYSSIENCSAENKPNVVLLSGVLQYLTDPHLVIDKICKQGSVAIVLDKLIINNSLIDSIHIQRVPESIYKAAYPCRSFSESMLLKHFLPTYKLKVCFPSLSFGALRKINSNFNGYILVKAI